MKLFKILPITLMVLCLYSSAFAQNTDLPGPTANIVALPVGSLVIAMDNTNQAAPGYFNLRAYGLAVTLMWANKRLRWVIKATKLKDGIDFTVLSERLYPSAVATSSKDYKAGPLVIFPADTAGVGAIINTFNSSLATNQKVNVYRTTAAVNVDMRYDLIGGKPKAAIMDDGGKATIHVGYMTAALIPTTAYSIRTTPAGFFTNCVTFVSEPHNSATIGDPVLNEIIDSIRLFVQRDGGNFLAECAAIRPYENSVNARFHYSLGVMDQNRSITPANNVYPNPDLSMSQFEGQFDMDDGGSLTNWSRVPGGMFNNNVHIGVKENNATKDTIGYSTSKMDSTRKGGLVTYLGNHQFASNSQIGVNGIRVFLNAFLTPARYPTCPPSGPLAVKFTDFKAKKINNNLVQLTWITGSEINSKDFIVERSSNGSNYYQIGKVQATGNSSVSTSYSLNDNSPVKGRNFYRIVEVDISGNRSFSPTAYININDGGVIKLEVYPNPASSIITINTGNSSSFTNTVQVFDYAGREVSSIIYNGNSTNMNISKLNAGNYIIKVTDSNGEFTQSKLTVTRGF